MFRPTPRQRLLAIAAGFSTGITHSLAVDATSLLVYSVGPLHVKPQLSLSERYDDNIFYRAGNAVEDDFVTVVSPGVNFQLGRRDANYILFDYQFDQLFYLQHSGQNSGDHVFSLNSNLAWKRLTVEGADRVQFLSGILGGTDNLGRRVDRRTYYDNYTIGYALTEKTGIYVAGLFDAVDYEKGTPLYDSNTLRGTGGFAFQVTPKSRLFGEVYYGQAAIDPNGAAVKGPHQEFLGGFLGARGEFTSRLTGRVKAGYEVREFSDRTPAPSAPVVEASLEQRFSDKTSLTLAYTRRNTVSVQVARLSYTADSVSGQLTQVLSSDGKLVGTIGGSFENDDYEEIGGPVRHNVWYRASAAVNYSIQLWLKAGLIYEFESYHSNQVIDYDVNRVSLRVSVGY